MSKGLIFISLLSILASLFFWLSEAEKRGE